MRLFICTPVYNGADTLERTIKSILDLEGRSPIIFHVKDGGSTDGTVELLRKWDAKLRSNRRISFSFSSGEDDGMYDAISESFSLPVARTADWLTWINADDYLLPRSGKIVEEVDAVVERPISWVSGKPATQTMDGELVANARPLTSEVIKLGLADGIHWEFFQQEGTFFRRDLWESSVDIERFKSFRVAGDWYLWKQLASSADVYLVAESLGVFCQVQNQLSSDMSRYLDEIDSVIPLAERKAAMKQGTGMSSRVKFLYPTAKGLYLRTMSVNGHYKYRMKRLKDD